MNKDYLVRLVVIVHIVCFSSTYARSHDQIPGRPQTRPIAILGATVHRIDAPKIDSGVVLFDEGKIVR